MSLVRFKLVFFVPSVSTREILNHLFTMYSQELGRIGLYDHCAFVTRGTGQFRPCVGANPAVGEIGQLEYVEEDRVELVINDKGKNEQVKDAIRELKSVHPYETVAYDVYRLEDF